MGTFNLLNLTFLTYLLWYVGAASTAVVLLLMKDLLSAAASDSESCAECCSLARASTGLF